MYLRVFAHIDESRFHTVFANIRGARVCHVRALSTSLANHRTHSHVFPRTRDRWPMRKHICLSMRISSSGFADLRTHSYVFAHFCTCSCTFALGRVHSYKFARVRTYSRTLVHVCLGHRTACAFHAFGVCFHFTFACPEFL